MLKWPDRTARERVKVGVDWSDALQDGDTIISNTMVTTYPLVIESPSMDGMIQSAWISGGSLGFAQVSCRVTTAKGEVLEEIVRLDTVA